MSGMRGFLGSAVSKGHPISVPRVPWHETPDDLVTTPEIRRRYNATMRRLGYSPIVPEPSSSEPAEQPEEDSGAER